MIILKKNETINSFLAVYFYIYYPLKCPKVLLAIYLSKKYYLK